MLNETEEEQIQAIKNWWQDNKWIVIIGALVGVTIIGSWQSFQYLKAQSRLKASTTYNELTQFIEQQNWTDSEKIAEKLITKYDNTPYASAAAMFLAKRAIEEKKYDQAKKHLNWLIDEGQHEGLQSLAKIHLAKVLLAEGQTLAAHDHLLNKETKGFEALKQKTLGDIFIKLNKPTQAIKAYQDALSSSDLSPQLKTWLEMKMNTIQSSKEQQSTEAEQADENA